MLNIRLQIKGNDEVAAHFKKWAAETPKGIARVIQKVALLVERYGKIYSPVRTGLMRSSIYPVVKNEHETWVGPKVEYAKYVHARIPFMTAARQDTLPSVDELLRKEVRDYLK